MTADLMPFDVDPAYARQLTDRIKTAVSATWELIKEAYTTGAWRALGYGSWDDYCTSEFGTSRLRLPREERQEVVGSLRDAGLSIRAISAGIGISDQTVQRDLRDRQVYQITTPEPAATPAPAIDVCPHCGNDMEDGQVCAGCYPPSADTVDMGEGAPLDDDQDDDQDDDDPALTDEECRALADPDDLDDEPEPARITGTDGRSYPASKPARTNRKPITDAFWTAVYNLGKKVTTVENLAADDRFKKNADQIRERNLSDLIRARDALQDVIDQLSA